MIDFLMISTRSTKRGVIEIYPKFIIKKSSDLMIRGGDFYDFNSVNCCAHLYFVHG